jgi:hypothetical protein
MPLPSAPGQAPPATPAPGAPAKPSKSAKRRAKAEREATIAAAEAARAAGGGEEPASEAEFERLVVGSPSSSYLWIRYMAFLISLGETDRARAGGRRGSREGGVRLGARGRARMGASGEPGRGVCVARGGARMVSGEWGAGLQVANRL